MRFQPARRENLKPRYNVFSRNCKWRAVCKRKLASSLAAWAIDLCPSRFSAQCWCWYDNSPRTSQISNEIYFAHLNHYRPWIIVPRACTWDISVHPFKLLNKMVRTDWFSEYSLAPMNENGVGVVSIPQLALLRAGGFPLCEWWNYTFKLFKLDSCNGADVNQDFSIDLACNMN